MRGNAGDPAPTRAQAGGGRRRLRTQLLHDRCEIGLDLDRLTHVLSAPVRKAADRVDQTRNIMARRLDCHIVRPRSRAVFEVIGPMLATCIPAGQGNPSARKFSTVDELVKVIISAPSSGQARSRFRPIARFRDGSVGKSNIHNGSQGSRAPLVAGPAPPLPARSEFADFRCRLPF